MLFLIKRQQGAGAFCDINAEAINDFYYSNLDFDQASPNAQRLHTILTKLERLLLPGKHAKLRAHDAIHAVLLVDSLMDEYAPDWIERFPAALDKFLEGLAIGKSRNKEGKYDEFWAKYGQWTRVNSDRGDIIAMRHTFYLEKMLEYLQPLKSKDPKRLYGEVERTILFYRQSKRCAGCDGPADWDDIEVHHVEEHSVGGPTILENGAVVHKTCHPKGVEQTAAFAAKWALRKEAVLAPDIAGLKFTL